MTPPDNSGEPHVYFPAFYGWLQDTSVGDTIRNSKIIFPCIEICHLLGLVLLVGTVLIINLNLLGLGMRRQRTCRIAEQLLPFTYIGLTMMLLTGPLLLMADAMKISKSAIFLVKMSILPLAVLYHFTIFRKMTSNGADLTPLRARLVGGGSLLLWFGTAFVGKAVEIF